MQCVSKSQSLGSFNEREGPRKVRNVLAHPPMAKRRVQASAMLELRSQPIERRFRPVVLDAVLEGDTETDHECLFPGSFSADMLSMCGSCNWFTCRQRADPVASPMSSWLEQEEC